jgi:SAM-dependent methyltransferase
MANVAVVSSNEEKTDHGDSLLFLRKMANGLSLLKRGFAVLRNWKIYAEFSSPAYQRHNVARLQHLDSLGLDLTRKSVLEVGAGVGDHSLFYLYRNCRVLAVEGRADLAKKLSERLGIEVMVVDVDRGPEGLQEFGHFDLVHCYGLLYHLSNPAKFLSAVSGVGDCLLLETCVSLGDEIRLGECRENSAVPSQALNKNACRPTRTWVFETLKLYYEYVYATTTQPNHPEFPLDWDEPSADGPLLKRAVFIASHTPISNPNLIPELPRKQNSQVGFARPRS